MDYFTIEIQGCPDGSVNWKVNFENRYFKNSDTDVDKIICIAKELKETVIKLRKNFGQDYSEAAEPIK